MMPRINLVTVPTYQGEISRLLFQLKGERTEIQFRFIENVLGEVHYSFRIRASMSKILVA